MENLFSTHCYTFQPVVTIMMADANPAAVSRDGQSMGLPEEEGKTSESTLFGEEGLGGCCRGETTSY